MTHKILVTGALGNLGSALTQSLRAIYDPSQVIASDIQLPSDRINLRGPYERINVLSSVQLSAAFKEHHFTQVYHLSVVHPTDAAINPMLVWDLEIKGLMNILEIAAENKVSKIFWPGVINSDELSVAGISKIAGEHWCRYYTNRYHLDVRTMRLPCNQNTDVAIAAILQLMEVSPVIV